jgi:hypothetical protein
MVVCKDLTVTTRGDRAGQTLRTPAAATGAPAREPKPASPSHPGVHIYQPRGEIL